MGGKGRGGIHSEPFISNECVFSDEVSEYYVESIWIYHGFWSGFFSSFSWVTGNSVTHWYVVIGTKQGRYYCAQFGVDDQLRLTKHSTYLEARLEGFKTIEVQNEYKSVTIKYSGRPNNRTIKDVENFIRSRNQRYDLFWNNCQDFGTAFARWC